MKTVFLLFSGMIFLSFSTKQTTESNDGAYAIKLSWTPNSSANSENCSAILNPETWVLTSNQGCSLNIEVLRGELDPENERQMELSIELLKEYLADNFSKEIEEVHFKEIIFLGNSDFHSSNYTVIVNGKEKVFGISKNH